MKKLLASLLIFIIAGLITTTTAHSTTYEFHSDNWQLSNMYYNRYYNWGIELAGPLEGEIVAASMFISNIRSAGYGYGNDLWVHLLDEATGPGDYDSSGDDYFNGQGELIFHGHNLPYSGLSIDYDFTPDEIKTFNNYADNLKFGLGFDPDYNFCNQGIKLTLVTAKVPEPSIWMLLAIGSIFVAVIEITRLLRYLRQNSSEPEFRHVMDL